MIARKICNKELCEVFVVGRIGGPVWGMAYGGACCHRLTCDKMHWYALPFNLDNVSNKNLWALVNMVIDLGRLKYWECLE